MGSDKNIMWFFDLELFCKMSIIFKIVCKIIIIKNMQVTNSLLSKMIVQSQARTFATASIRDRFETAYVARKADLAKQAGKK